MKTRQVQTNFTAGVISPQLFGQTDFKRYRNGLEQGVNGCIMPQGGFEKRPGFQFIAETKTSAKASRVVPFAFSNVQTYVIEFGENYIRFYRNQGQITSGGSPYEISSPYSEADLAGLKFAQSADVMYISHPDYEPRKLSRTGHASWSLALMDNYDGPYLGLQEELPGLINTVTLTAAATTGSGVTLTASGNLFTADDVGRLVRLKASSTWGYGKIVTYTSATSVDVDIVSDFDGTTATTEWRLGSWSGRTGYPLDVFFFEQRLYFANTTEQPNTFWASRSGVDTKFWPENFSPDNDTNQDEVDADTAFTVTLAERGNIYWSLSIDRLYLGTTNGVFLISSATTDEAISALTVKARRILAQQCAEVEPAAVQNVALFVNFYKSKMHNLAYAFEDDGYRSPDLSLLSPNLVRQQMDEIVYQEEPYSIVWARTPAGKLLSLTYMRPEEIVAWTEHEVGSTDDGPASVESITVINGQDHDELWAIVRRTINGSTKRYVECMGQFFNSNVIDNIDYNFVDSHLKYSGAATTTLSGLDHLEGETVSVIVNQGFHPDRVVSSGQIELEVEATTATVGLAYVSKLETMPVVFNTRVGTSEGAVMSVDKAFVKFYNTVGAKVGASASGNLETLHFRSHTDIMGKPVGPETSIKEVFIDGSPDYDAQVYIEHPWPLPLTVLAVAYKIEVSDD